MMMFTVTLP
jgi:hypothetical protein